MKAMAMTSFLLFCNRKLLPSVASTHTATWLHKPSRQKEDAPAPHLWLAIIIFQTVIMHCKPDEQREKLRGSKAAGSPREPLRGCGCKGPHSLRDRLWRSPRAAWQEDPQSGAGQPFPVDLFLGLLPCHQLMSQHLNRCEWLKESGKGRSYLSMYFLQAKEAGRTVLFKETLLFKEKSPLVRALILRLALGPRMVLARRHVRYPGSTAGQSRGEDLGSRRKLPQTHATTLLNSSMDL